MIIQYWKFAFLVWIKMLVLICTNILDTEVDLINISFFSHPRGGIGRNVIIIVVDMSSSIKIDSKKKNNSWYRSYTRIRRYTEGGLCIPDVVKT